jgi:hypothetical protein
MSRGINGTAWLLLLHAVKVRSADWMEDRRKKKVGGGKRRTEKECGKEEHQERGGKREKGLEKNEHWRKKDKSLRMKEEKNKDRTYRLNLKRSS